jgi:16S rRNA (uracil1498-N3)-methyltransferase
MRRRFFVENFDANAAVLRGDAAEHLGRVLRAQAGQLYELSDGQGVWLARVERVLVSKRDDHRIEFSLVEPIPSREPPLAIRALISLVKFERFEWCLEKATELDVTEIVPLAAARTDKPLLTAARKRHARWERILLESAQQSRRLRPPIIGPLKTPQSAFAASTANCKLILSERRETQPIRDALALLAPVSSAALAIGPEGGWTDAEVMAARGHGFVEASLGEGILRTETAVLSSIAIVRFAAGT